MGVIATVASTLPGSRAPSSGSGPSEHENRAPLSDVVIRGLVSSIRGEIQGNVECRDDGKTSASRGSTDTVAATSSLCISITATGSCSVRPTTVSASLHSASSSLLPQPVLKLPPTPSPFLFPTTYELSNDFATRSSSSDTHTVSESRSPAPEKPPQSSFVCPHSVTTVKSSLTRSLTSVPAETTSLPLATPVSSRVSKSHGSLPLAVQNQLNPASRTTASLSMVTTTTLTDGASNSITCGTPGGFQTHPTVTGTVTETSVSTFYMPSPTIGLSDGHLTEPESASPATTTDGTVVSMTHINSNSMQNISGPSAGHSFFGNHPAVISVFLVSGMAAACIGVLAIYCCRRRQRQNRRHGRNLQGMSSPSKTAATQNLFSVSLIRSEGSLPMAHGTVDTPLSPPLAQVKPKRSSYRVPVPYANWDVDATNSPSSGWKYAGPSNDFQPVGMGEGHPSPNVPPPLPRRSPLRTVAAKKDEELPQNIPNRLTRTSSLSFYPPSLSPSNAEADSLYQKEVGVFASQHALGPSPRGLPFNRNSGMERSSKYSQVSGLSGVDSDGGASLAFQAQDSPLSGHGPTGPDVNVARSSILDGRACHTPPLARAQRVASVEYTMGR
ncbi:hypothetical protein BC827DRAFT_68758 [Russula dissimulans]|nr:hypothetical protein BC827DRAFT_68758 [Russula dissimulans]